LEKFTIMLDNTEVVRVNPRDHPWIGNKSLLNSVAAVSPELASIVEHKTEHINNGVGWNSPCRDREGGACSKDGSLHINYQVTRDGNKWTFQFLGRSYENKPLLEERFANQGKPAPKCAVLAPATTEADSLTIEDRGWTLLRGGKEVASGQF
jgi:hypothetical protein